MKGSFECLTFGLEFANAITIVIDETEQRNFRPVDCKGTNSVFSALSISIPSVVRTSDCTRNKGAISEIELFKFLVKSGYIPHRLRSRVKGTTDKWTKGINRWKCRRWVDTRKPDDMDHLRTKLEALRRFCSPTYSICERSLLEFLSARSEVKRTESDIGAAEPMDWKLCREQKAIAIPREQLVMHRRWVLQFIPARFIAQNAHRRNNAAHLSRGASRLRTFDVRRPAGFRPTDRSRIPPPPHTHTHTHTAAQRTPHFAQPGAGGGGGGGRGGAAGLPGVGPGAVPLAVAAGQLGAGAHRPL